MHNIILRPQTTPTYLLMYKIIMKILCCSLRATLLTGSEIYFHELCSTLTELGHDVTLASGEISEMFRKKSIESKYKLLYLNNIPLEKYELIILSHFQTTYKYVETIAAPIINICHSEIYDTETPLISEKVIKYVGIRPTICEKIKSFGINENKIELIRNPIDLKKFNTYNTTDGGFGLFVGTMGGLRFKAAKHFSEFCKVNNLESVYVSAENIKLPFYNINLGPQINIEKLFKSCTISGGIIRGRTYFEARLCGKKTIEYFLDSMGAITDVQYEDEPTHSELITLKDEFDRIMVAKRILELK